MRRDLVLLTVLAVGALATLVGLGAWQMQRLEWKEGLIARIESRTAAEPVTLEEALRQWETARDVEYLRVRLQGVFDHSGERHFFNVLKGETGWQVITPLVLADGRVVLVDRGFVPHPLKAAGKRREGQVTGTQELVGLARSPGVPGLFTPDNNVDANEWFWRDLQGMAQSTLDKARQERLVPFFVDQEASNIPGGWPKGGVTRKSLPNKHLSYALTWFGLAGVLLVVFGLYLRGRLRSSSFT